MDKQEHRIGILGGCFDPIHIGHLIIAEAARQCFALGKVIFVPAGRPPHRDMPVASSFHRFEMTRRAIGGNKFFTISDIEIKKQGISYTFDTLMFFKKQTPADFFIIVGWDTFSILPSWYKAGQLVKETTFLVAPRLSEKNTNLDVPFSVDYHILDIPRIEISSTIIRNKLKTNQSVRYLVPDVVFYYIEKENLYG
ncbi:MAG TPA: nicotinate-nucleotide adenylyltransferase [bacterium]|nr:nicotinate-nucleotide adenylyltransferase [bacterium]